MRFPLIMVLLLVPAGLSSWPLDLDQCALDANGALVCAPIFPGTPSGAVMGRHQSGLSPPSGIYPDAPDFDGKTDMPQNMGDIDPDTPKVEGHATRIFAGPSEYPPQDFGAYAIVAFKSGADASDRERYLMFCKAYSLSIPESNGADAPRENQLVTVWPVATADLAKQVTAMNDMNDMNGRCEIAVSGYGNTTALRAIANARKVSQDVRTALKYERGPFLLAWNPATAYGEENALILRMDLSNINDMTAAKRNFEFWVQQIETRPELWQDEWQQESIRQRIADSADRYGQIIIDFFGG
jgi:hypothetical protein